HENENKEVKYRQQNGKENEESPYPEEFHSDDDILCAELNRLDRQARNTTDICIAEAQPYSLKDMCLIVSLQVSHHACQLEDAITFNVKRTKKVFIYFHRRPFICFAEHIKANRICITPLIHARTHKHVPSSISLSFTNLYSLIFCIPSYHLLPTVHSTQRLLRLFGIPYLVSPQEAEAQCVALERDGFVDAVASDDSDVWPFGGQRVVRYLFGGLGRASSTSATHTSKKDSSSRQVASQDRSQPFLYDNRIIQTKLGELLNLYNTRSLS
ncbi:unnamed protein product, partial [Protopolystoma xenopodis]